MKKGNKIVKVVRYFALLSVMALGLVSIIGTGGGSGGGGGGGGDGATPLATGEFTKTVALTSTGNLAVPFSGDSCHLQQLYLAGDIDGSGYIQSIELRLDQGTTGCSATNATIKMGHTSLGVLTTSFAGNVEEGKGTLETVRSGAFSVPAGSSGDYFTIPLDTPFLYNGVDNLVVEFIVDDSDPSIYLIRSDTAASRMNYNNLLGAPNGMLYSNLLHTKFNFEGGDNEIDHGGANGNTLIFSNNTYHTQTLYLSSEINGSGPITGIAFQVNATTSDGEYTVTVKLAHTTLGSLGDTFADNLDAGAATVMANALTFKVPAGITPGGWFWLPLPDGTFNYNGTDNLLVDIDNTVSTAPGTMIRTAVIAGRRLHNTVNDALTGDVEASAAHAKFRFNGGPVEVIQSANSVWSIPFYDDDYRTQILFDAWQLGTGGPVTGISFRLANDSELSDYPSATVVLDHTASTVLNADFADNLTNPTTVFTGILNVPAGLKAGDWVTIPISGFAYDPTQNLVVEVTQDAGAVINQISASSADVPGASGVMNGPRANPSGSGNPGQSDIRIYLGK